MPELPEVESARRKLARWTEGRTIVRAHVPDTRLLRGKSPAGVRRWLTGRAVLGVERRGKHLLFELDGGAALHLHFGMSGSVDHVPTAGPGDRKHVRLRLDLDDARSVLFEDPRMFGVIEAGPAGEVRASAFGDLGPDPLADPFDAGVLAAALGRTRRPIKIALLDQALIAGIGNIHAAEALWRAKIHPARPTSELTRAELRRLASAIEETIAHGIATMDEPWNPFFVYDRSGARCTRCRRGVIVQTEQGQRSTYHCPRCQKR